MKMFGYLDDVISWQSGLEWYWSYGLAIGIIGVFYLLFLYFRYKYGWFN